MKHVENASGWFVHMLNERVNNLVLMGNDDMKRKSLANISCIYSTLTDEHAADLKELVRDVWFKITRSMDSPKNSPFYHS